MSSASDKRLSRTDYTAYRIQQREHEFSLLLRGGRLFQQYLVDMWAAADQSRLNYFRYNQKEVRATLYKGLNDAANNNVDLHDVGQRFVLPSSYTGGPRYMKQCLQDALALARYHKKIDLFITVTCNPNWPEITRELLPGQTAADRPDLCARVFNMKKQAIIADIYKHGIFGKAVAYVYTIEFQKRGLPHMHILIFLQHGDKIQTPEQVDSAVWAHWPDPQSQPVLFETIKRCMIHTCGDRCLENGKCSKGYPKPFQLRTNVNDEGYPLYSRPQDGRSYEVKGTQISNQWIVPYNPWLSAKYDCHINVECLASFATLKYVNKYIHKGSDRTTLQVSNKDDEIQRHIDSRFVGASEGVWRIFQFPIHKQVPNVVRLQIHLPGCHFVVFDPDEPPERVNARAAQEKTTLTAFFRANADPAMASVARELTYQEFPQQFVYDETLKAWHIRKQGFALGRMYFVPPKSGDELFYLRTLLAVVKGPTSFEDLRRFNNVTYPTFHEACLARGLLEDDGEWRQCLLEASYMQTGEQLWHLFALLLLSCIPNSPEQLWNDFRQHICDDLRAHLRSSGWEIPRDDDIFDYGLWLLNSILLKHGKDLQSVNMPLPDRDWSGQAGNSLIGEQLNYDRDQEHTSAEQRIPQLNPEQRQAHDRIVSSVETRAGQVFFLNGPGGTGKTFVYNTVCNTIRSKGWIVLCVASSGIASLLLRGGRTAHSMFKIPLKPTDESYCPIAKQGNLANLIRATRLIIWDEITMQHRYAAETVDRTCRDLLSTPDRPFGGITVVFGGDFQQILPVVRNGSRADIVFASLLRSKLWDGIQVLKLTRNMRLVNDPDAQIFSSWLLDIGHGRGLGDNETIPLPQGMITLDVDDFVAKIYPDIQSSPPPPPEYFLHRMILAPRNNDVDSTNSRLLSMMSGEEQVFYSADTVTQEAGADDESSDVNTFPVEFLRSLTASGLPPGELRLKPGCPLILLRNLSPARGLCNGTRLILMRMSSRVLEVRIIGGEYHGKTEFIPRITLSPTEDEANFSFQLKRRQFPVRLAFSITINKAQGQSVERVGIDLRVPVFSHGQLYVALSRATSSRNVKILLSPDQEDTRTTNVVYPEVLASEAA